MLSVDSPGATEAILKARELIKSSIPPNAQLFNLYFWGSRWFGNSKSESDWDFMAVVSNDYIQPPVGNVAESEDLDVVLITENKFKQMLEDHIPFVLPFLFYPENGIIQEQIKFELKIQLPKLKKALLVNQDINLKQSQNQWRDGSCYKAKKKVFFVIQMIMFSIQISEFGKVVDLTEPNKFHETILADYPNWKDFSNIFSPIKENLISDFKKSILKYQIFEGISELFRNLSISCDFHPEFKNVVYLHHSNEFTPWTSRMGQETRGLLLQIENVEDGIEKKIPEKFSSSVICFTEPKIYSFHEKDDKINKNTKYFELIDGKNSILYFYKNSWHVASENSPLGEDLILDPIKNKKIKFPSSFV